MKKNTIHFLIMAVLVSLSGVFLMCNLAYAGNYTYSPSLPSGYLRDSAGNMVKVSDAEYQAAKNGATITTPAACTPAPTTSKSDVVVTGCKGFGDGSVVMGSDFNNYYRLEPYCCSIKVLTTKPSLLMNVDDSDPLTATSKTIEAGTSVRIGWSLLDAPATGGCSASNAWSGVKETPAVNGWAYATVTPPEGRSVYNITCRNEAGDSNVPAVTIIANKPVVQPVTPPVTPTTGADLHSPEGYVDEIDSDNCKITGWVYDPDVPNTPISFRIYNSSGASAGPYVTNLFRSDVNADKGISGNHGFQIEFATNNDPLHFFNKTKQKFRIQTVNVGSGNSNELPSSKGESLEIQCPYVDPLNKLVNFRRSGGNQGNSEFFYKLEKSSEKGLSYQISPSGEESVFKMALEYLNKLMGNTNTLLVDNLFFKRFAGTPHIYIVDGDLEGDELAKIGTFGPDDKVWISTPEMYKDIGSPYATSDLKGVENLTGDNAKEVSGDPIKIYWESLRIEKGPVTISCIFLPKGGDPADDKRVCRNWPSSVTGKDEAGFKIVSGGDLSIVDTSVKYRGGNEKPLEYTPMEVGTYTFAITSAGDKTADGGEVKHEATVETKYPVPECSDHIDNDQDGFCDVDEGLGGSCKDGSRPGDPGCKNDPKGTNEASDNGPIEIRRFELIQLNEDKTPLVNESPTGGGGGNQKGFNWREVIPNLNKK